MCNCIKDINNRLLNHIQSACQENEIIERATGLLNVAFIIPDKKDQPTGQGMFMGTCQEFEYYHTRIKKDGTTGRRVAKTDKINHTFCPFCGAKYPETI